MQRLVLILGVATLLASGEGLSQEQKWTHYGLRPLAMGNAFVSVADDFNALFYNPAGLARLKEWDGEFLNPGVELSDKTKTSISKISDLAAGSSDSTTAALDLIESEAGNNHHLGIQWTPHLIFKGFGFGIGASVEANMVFHRYPSIALDVGPRVIIPFAFAFNALEDRLSMGFAVKARLRGGINHEFSIQDIEAFSKKDGSEGPELANFVEGGFGYGSDFGLLFTPIKTMEPTLGLSIMDIGGTPYGQKMDIGGKALGTPDAVLPSLNLGLSLKPIQTNRTYLLTVIEMHQLNQPFSFSKKLNLGLEYGLGSIIKLMAGLHQGYLTGGFQFDVGLINLRVVTYAEELGAVAGSVQDRRYALQLKLLL